MNDERLDRIEQEIALLKARNARVEADKAWETSSFRIGTLTLTIYAVAACLLSITGSHNIWQGAIVPAVGFFLSSLSLPLIKRWWIGRATMQVK